MQDGAHKYSEELTGGAARLGAGPTRGGKCDRGLRAPFGSRNSDMSHKNGRSAHMVRRSYLPGLRDAAWRHIVVT